MKFARSPLSFAVLTVLAVTTHANESQLSLESTTDQPSVELNRITVHAEEKHEVGKTIYTKEDLEKTPNSSKNITDFLKVNPNVQFDREQRSSSSQAELKPAEISINGAQFYQNKFLINGVNNSNVFDPLGSQAADTGFSTGSQGMSVNTDLLCKLEVLDSNIGAEYSQFTGGVVSAETCAPNTKIGQLHGSITYDYTESDWARYNLTTPKEIDDFQEPTANNQKEFKKSGISSNLYGKLNDRLGFNVYGSKRESIIPVLSGFSNPKKINQERNNINLGSTVFYDLNPNNKLKLGFDYGDIDALTYVESRRDSQILTHTESTAVFAEFVSELDRAKVTQKINYQKMNSERQSDKDYGISWLYSEHSKNWSSADPITKTSYSSEGSTTGSLNQIQDSLSYSVKSEFAPFKINTTAHQITVGTGYDHYQAKWERPKNFNLYTSTGINKLTHGQVCSPNDQVCDEASTFRDNAGQYFYKGILHKSGSIEAQQDQWHLFAQDQMDWKNFDLRLGLRADYSSLNHDLNIAPRTSLNYKPFNNNTLQIHSGFNQYYGAQLLSTVMHDKIADLKFDIQREKNPSATEWSETTNPGYTNTSRTDLKTPYSNETVFGLTSQISNWEFGLKWVHRDAKNEITRDRYVYETTFNNKPVLFTDYFIYSNNGQSKTDIYSFTLRNLLPLNVLNTQHQFAVGFDYTDSFKNFVDYSATYEANHPDSLEDRLVQYGGKIISWSDRPAENFNQPWTARLSWDIGFNNLPLKINNFLSYKSSYQDAIQVKDIEYEGAMIDAYEVDKIKPRFSWDIRTTYDLKLANDKDLVFGLTINNLTNRVNTYTSQYLNSNTIKSEIGRQFIADVTFKF